MRKLIIVAVCAVVLGVAGPAWADSSPSSSAYGGTANNQISRVQGTSASRGSTLPFTGLNVGVLAVIALALVGTGVVLRLRVGSDSH